MPKGDDKKTFSTIFNQFFPGSVLTQQTGEENKTFRSESNAIREKSLQNVTLEEIQLVIKRFPSANLKVFQMIAFCPGDFSEPKRGPQLRRSKTKEYNLKLAGTFCEDSFVGKL